MKHIELNNETFVVKKAKGELHPITQVRGLGDCYAKPSSIKYEIYNKKGVKCECGSVGLFHFIKILFCTKILKKCTPTF